MKVVLPLVFGVVLLAGCGDKPADATPATTGSDAAVTTGSPPPATGAAGKYSLTKEGVTVSIELRDDMTFEMIAPRSNGKGKYTHEGDKVVLAIEELNGVPATEKDKAMPVTLTLSADGKLTGLGGDMVLIKQ